MSGMSAYPRMRTALAVLSIVSVVIVLFMWLYVYVFFVPPANPTGWEQLGAFILAATLSAPAALIFIVAFVCSLRMALSVKATMADIKWGVAISTLSIFGLVAPFYVYLGTVVAEHIANLL